MQGWGFSNCDVCVKVQLYSCINPIIDNVKSTPVSFIHGS